MMHAPPQDITAWLLAELRAKDYPRYAVCLFAPEAKRADLAALFLLNAELAQIHTQVTEPLLGQIRLQWWQDGLAALGTPQQPPHRLFSQLASWQQRGHDLAPLEQLLTARAADLLPAPFPDLAAYHNYQQASSLPLGSMAARLCQATPATAALYATALLHYTTGGLLLAIPAWLQRRRLPLPPEWLTDYGIDPAALAECKPQAGLTRLVQAQATQLQSTALQLRRTLRRLPVAERKNGMSLWLHNELALRQAARLLRQPTLLLHRPQQTAPTGLLGTLLWHSLCLGKL
jgi:NADH dehydrogenase [ubiquinone] 1 alpha subcomplex assembly factor 6